MPELPEVEIVKQSVERSILFQKINDVLIKNRKLRFKIQNNLNLQDMQFFLQFPWLYKYHSRL